ncbi:MAG: hypothetical protein GC203_06995 [Phenylobacterium sp.]|uniref:hypothetical protein n=1 Tax=Phenylobacterium sp. TaxID=1871053 RepID=UPI0025F3F5C4|nr:hypothetical protein [Phenylobacterium sp.]MBI1197590.1 hypothetical protein [Phenylobacterium sp.]
MIFHLSIAARDPRHVASVIAELWGGEALPFPPVAQGSWVAMAGDERGTTMEVYPAGAELRPAEGDADATAAMNPSPARHVATHAAIASPLSAEAVQAIAAREGWLSKYRKRGGVFGVIEFWLENAVMLEVLTPEMQQEYTGFMSPDAWRAMLAAGPPGAAAAG